MARIRLVLRDGDERSLAITPGMTLMELIRGAGIDDLAALCGGCLSCATCHVYIDEGSLGALPPMTDEEDELLDSSDHRRANSRLSCQITLDQSLDGLGVVIAPED